MKKVFYLLILLTLGVARTLCAGNAIRLAVLEFENNTGRADVEHLKKGLRDFFVTDLQGVSGVTLVERGRIDEVLKEIKMTQSKYFDQATAAKIGKQMGASHILTGSYLCMNKKWRMDIRVVATATGEILVTGKQEGSEDDVFDMEKALVEAMAKKLKPDLSRRELRKINQVQTEKFSSFDKYSRAVDKAESGDSEGAVKLMEEVAREDKDFSLAADQLEKFRAKLLAELEQFAKTSNDKAVSDREYVEQDFKSSLEWCKLRDRSSDYYVSLVMAALHYGLRNKDKRYSGEIEKLQQEYEAEFLCRRHSPEELQEVAEKLDKRLEALRDRIFNARKSSGLFLYYKDQFKDFTGETITGVSASNCEHGGVSLYWPDFNNLLSENDIWQMWKIRQDPWKRISTARQFNSLICSLRLIFSCGFQEKPQLPPSEHLSSIDLNSLTPEEKKIFDEAGDAKAGMNAVLSKRLRIYEQQIKIYQKLSSRSNSVQQFISNCEERLWNRKADLKRIIEASICSSPPPGVENWDYIVLSTLKSWAEYEKDEEMRAKIKQAIVYAIDAKKKRPLQRGNSAAISK